MSADPTYPPDSILRTINSYVKKNSAELSAERPIDAGSPLYMVPRKK